MITRRRKRLAWLALIAAVLVGIYCWTGVAMTSSFAVAAPARAPGYRLGAFIYLGILCAALLVAIAAVTVLWRAKHSSEPPAT